LTIAWSLGRKKSIGCYATLIGDGGCFVQRLQLSLSADRSLE